MKSVLFFAMSFVMAGLLSCQNATKQVVNNLATNQIEVETGFYNDQAIEKVKIAMLTMQRHSWEQGTALLGLLEIGDTTKAMLMAKDVVLRSKPDGRLAMVYSDFNIADPGVNGPGMLAAYEVTGDEKYKLAAQALYEFLKRPESKNEKGVILHNTRSGSVFSDNMFMVAPFMAMMGDHDESMKQIEGIRDLLWNEKEKLFHHIKEEGSPIFRDSSFWGGGNGWCAAAMAQGIDILPEERTMERERLIKYCVDLLDGCIANQLPNGLLYDKITIPNFEETTLPSMLAYTIYTGVRSGWLPKSYLVPANKMRKAVCANIDEVGHVQNASSIPWFNKSGISPEGQAFFLMMEGAYRKMINENTKK